VYKGVVRGNRADRDEEAEDAGAVGGMRREGILSKD
jgi:hypothetical protein